MTLDPQHPVTLLADLINTIIQAEYPANGFVQNMGIDFVDADDFNILWDVKESESAETLLITGSIVQPSDEYANHPSFQPVTLPVFFADNAEDNDIAYHMDVANTFGQMMVLIQAVAKLSV